MSALLIVSVSVRGARPSVRAGRRRLQSWVEPTFRRACARRRDLSVRVLGAPQTRLALGRR